MFKSTLALSVLVLAAFGWQQERRRPMLRLKEEKLTLEYTYTANEAVILVEAESEEELDRVNIRRPDGELVFELRSSNGGDHGLMGFMVEMRESTVGSLQKTYPAGVYRIQARTADGRIAIGDAILDHDLPLAPEVVYPYEGAINVPTSKLVVRWLADREAVGYRVNLEQNENDGLTVELPPGTNQFQVPEGVLEPGTQTQLEVGAIGANGNCTLVEITFATM